MTDIVDRLREMTWGAGLCKIEECLEAADEIERLNKVIYLAAGMISTTEQWADKHPTEVVDMLNREVDSDG